MFLSDWLWRRLVYPSHFVVEPHPTHISGLERWWLTTTQGNVEVWLLPGDGVSAESPGPLVVYTHGNGELIDHWPETLAPYRRMGVSVLLPEYRGYGRSKGTPSQENIVTDLLAVLERAKEDARVDMRRVIYHGRSIGGGVACALAKKRPPNALILESTFVSLEEIACGFGCPRSLVRDRYESLPVLSAFKGPLLLFHGTRDTLIRVEHGKRLAAANPSAKLVLFEAGHNDLPWEGTDYWAEVEKVVKQVSGASDRAS